MSWSTISNKDFNNLLNIIEANKTLNDVKFANLSCGSTESDEVADSIYTLVRKNKSLLHLDISYLPLKCEDIYKICQACRKSRTLVSIHLSNSVIDTKEKVGEIRKIMRPRKRLKNFQDFVEYPDSDD
jgi:cysteine sulfinate desulfinase/cysteine desulfurase-like protein